MIPKLIHQFFIEFRNNPKSLNDFPLYLKSISEFKKNKGWHHHLWSEREVAALCYEYFPDVYPFFVSTEDIIKLDLAKYIISSLLGGVISDLDVIPTRLLDELILMSPGIILDRDSSFGLVGNDFFALPPGTLKNLPAQVIENKHRIDNIEIYRIWKMRRISGICGPKAFTKHLKELRLYEYKAPISSRYFRRDPKRDKIIDKPFIIIYHTLSWIAM